MIKKLYLFCKEGWEEASSIALHCERSWKFHNEDWEMIRLSSHEVKNEKEKYHFLKTHGGLWVDCSLFCNQPINNFLPQDSDLFFYKNKDRIYPHFIYLNSSDHPVALDILDLLENNPKAFINHHIPLVDKELWESLPELDNHLLVHFYGFHLILTREMKEMLDNINVPFFELDVVADLHQMQYHTKSPAYYLYSKLFKFLPKPPIQPKSYLTLPYPITHHHHNHKKTRQQAIKSSGLKFNFASIPIKRVYTYHNPIQKPLNPLIRKDKVSMKMVLNYENYM